MAKVKTTTVKFRGQVGEVVFVDSGVYGMHTRSPRGSKKECSVNDTLRKNAERTRDINAFCQRLYGVLREYSKDFRHGQLWQRMLSAARSSAEDKIEAYITRFTGLEINRVYPFSSLFGRQVQVKTETADGDLVVGFEYGVHPNFNVDEELKGYSIELISIFPSDTAFWANSSYCTELISFSQPLPCYVEARFPIPGEAKGYFVVAKAVGEPMVLGSKPIPAKRMQIAAGGRLG